MISNDPEDRDSQDISEVLEMIRRIACEEDSGVIASDSDDASSEFAPEVKSVANFPSVADTTSPTDAHDFPSQDAEGGATTPLTPRTRDKTPRDISSLKDTRMAMLAVQAWLDFDTDSRSAGAMSSACFGPDISKAAIASGVDRETQQNLKNGNEHFDNPYAPLLPGGNGKVRSIQDLAMERIVSDSLGSFADLAERQTRTASPSGSRAINEATAQLLRPLIVEWVNENMPRFVERALSSDTSGGKNKEL